MDLVLIGSLLLTALFAPASGPGQQQHRFDLKGDVLGESLATFKASHTRAHCRDTSDTVVSCRQPDASFAGHNPYIYYEHEGDCPNCGLAADFFKGRLTFISYNVSNREGFHERSVFDLLTAKFGKPASHASDSGFETAQWKVKDEMLSLIVTKQEPHPDITVSLERAKSSDSKEYLAGKRQRPSSIFLAACSLAVSERIQSALTAHGGHRFLPRGTVQ